MKSRGEGLNREEWYSVCSMHHDYDENCGACNVGSWINVHEHDIDSNLHDTDYEAWYEKANSKSLKFHTIDGKDANPFPNLT